MHNYTPTGGTVTSSDQRTVITIVLNSADIIGLKYSGTPLASASNRVYLSIAPSTISDTGGLFLRELIPPLSALDPNRLTPSTSHLTLQEFTIDIFKRYFGLNLQQHCGCKHIQ